MIFLVGSALCGMAGPTCSAARDGMTQLIAFRAIQGLGAGGLMVGVMAIIGDLVPPRERGRYQGFMAAIMAVAMIGGPLVGGFITDHLGWRWAFYVNLPLGGLALLVIVTSCTCRKQAQRAPHRLAGRGAADRRHHRAGPAHHLGRHASTPGARRRSSAWPRSALVTLVAFGFVERRVGRADPAAGPVRQPQLRLISGVGFLLGFAMFGAMTFLPLFQQSVQGASATNSGLLLLPMMVAAMLVSLFVGQLITRTGHYKIFPVLGGAVMAVAMFLLSTHGREHAAVADRALHGGARLRHGLPDADHHADRAEQRRDEGPRRRHRAATFFRSIGGSIGVSLFGAVFNNQLTDQLTDRLGAAGRGVDQRWRPGGPGGAQAVSAGVHREFMVSLATAISEIFVWAIVFAVAVPLLALLIKDVPLRGAPTEAPKDTEPQDTPCAGNGLTPGVSHVRTGCVPRSRRVCSTAECGTRPAGVWDTPG